MANRIIVDPTLGDQTLVLGGSDFVVTGTSNSETLNIQDGINVTANLAAGNDRLNLSQDLNAYSFSQSGNQLIITDGNGDEITLTVSPGQTKTVAFGDGSADVTINDNGIFTIGGEAFDDDFAKDNISLDPEDPSPIPGPGPGPQPGFELTQSVENAQVVEGNTVTYTLTADEAVDSPRTFSFSVGGNEVTGDDFASANAGTFTIPANSTSGSFDVDIAVGDGVELSESYTVTVSGDGQQVASIGTTIIDDDGGDQTPPAIDPDQTLTYEENVADVTTALGQVTATDEQSSVASFSLSGGNGNFAIDDSGNITLTEAGLDAAANDFESDPNEFTVEVTATDANNNTSDPVEVTLNVQDVDDIAPTISSSVVDGNTARITFNERLNQNVAPATGDFDVSLQGGSGSIAVNAVTINDRTVELTLGRSPSGGETFEVDYTPGANPLQDPAGNEVAAFDNQALVQDTQAPTIDANQSFSYEEESLDMAGDVVGQVSASDDVGINDFNITSGNGSGFFAIDNSGQITLTEAGVAEDAASFDFETSPNQFTLGIEAVDGANNTASENVTVNVTNVDDDDQGQVFTLTDAIDNFGPNQSGDSQTTDGNDTIIGDDQGGVGGSPIDAGDVVNGAGGEDRLELTFGGDAPMGSTTINATLNSSNVETHSIQSIGGNPVDFNSINSSDVDFLVDNRSTKDLTFSNVQELATVRSDGTPASSNSNHAFTVQFATSLVSGALDVELNNANLTALNVGDSSSGAEFSTINITATGNQTNVVDDINNGNTNNFTNGGLRTVNISGDGSYNQSGELEQVTTIDASDNSGGVDVTIDDSENVTFTGGAGRDNVDVSAATTINGVSNNDDLSGGDNTDTLTVANGNDFNSNNFANVRGFEILRTDNSNAETFDIDAIIGNNPLTGVTVAGSDETTVENINDGALGNLTISLNSNNNVTFTAKNFTSGGTQDTATINLSGADVDQLQFANLDQLTLNSNTAANYITTLNTGDLESITASGGQALTINSVTSGSGITEFDGSGLTGPLTLDVSQDTTGGGILVFGSNRADTVIGTGTGSDDGDTFELGAGSDTARISTEATGNQQRDVFEYSATSFNSDDVLAGQVDTITGLGGAGTKGFQLGNNAAGFDPQDDIIDFTSEFENLLQFQGQNLGNISANEPLSSNIGLGNNTNVAVVDDGAALLLRFDLNGNGSFQPTSDFQITLAGLGDGDPGGNPTGPNVAYNASEDVFFVST